MNRQLVISICLLLLAVLIIVLLWEGVKDGKDGLKRVFATLTSALDGIVVLNPFKS